MKMPLLFVVIGFVGTALIRRLITERENIRRWWLRWRHGYVAAPAGSSGTNWQQHAIYDVGFTCQCGLAQAFERENFVIMERSHAEKCPNTNISLQNAAGTFGCACPIAAARWVRICPKCKLGHWKLWDGAQNA